MCDEPENVMLVLLRRMDAKLDRLAGDMADVKVRLSSLGSESGHHRIGLAGVNSRLDRLEVRVERVERRLDLIDAPAG